MGPRKSSRKSTKSRKNRKSNNSANKPTVPIEEIEEVIVFSDNPSAYFLRDVSIESHLNAQTEHRERYLATFYHLMSMKVEILPNAKVKSLTCAFARHDQQMAQCFLSMKKMFNFVEIAKAISILDAPRKIGALKKKITKLQSLMEEKQLKVNDSTIRRLENRIEQLHKAQCATLPVRSVTGALCKHIQHWTQQLTEQELTFMVLNFDLRLWRELADVVHLHPSRDFPQLPWFLPHCYGAPAPENSILKEADGINAENVNERLAAAPMPFHKVSQFKQQLSAESKARIAEHEDTVYRAIWWYEDMCCPEVDAVIERRLAAESAVPMGYGKLMERLILLQPLNVNFFPALLRKAEEKLATEAGRHNLAGPVAVFADASSSMNVAIRTATIISSFLTLFTKARLIFFNDAAWEVTQTPGSIADVIDMAIKTQASRSTAPAAALWPFFERKEQLKTIIIVTDEEENTNCNNYRFGPLFDKYVQEVCECQLIFVSFLRGQHSRGQMVEELRQSGGGKHASLVSQHVMNGERPDVGRLDSIVGRMSLSNEGFLENVMAVEQMLRESDDLPALFNKMDLAN